ncbi:MAG: hypothetical protein WBC71_11650 [Salaquimonas sp.]
MPQEFYATLLFWSAFTISAGPFWTATMAAATTTSFRQIYSDYVLYLIFGWLPIIVVISTIMATLGTLGESFNLALHGIGSLVIFWMAFKIFRSVPGKAGSFDFSWKAMCLVTWTNPKVWLLVPVGFLSAGITSNTPVNVALYYLIGIPFFLAGVFVWGSIGRIGAKISLKYINRFNAFLMFAFGLYLAYGGWRLMQ